MRRYTEGQYILSNELTTYRVTRGGRGIISCKDIRGKVHYIWDKNIIAYYSVNRAKEEKLPASTWFKKEFPEYFI